MIENTDKKAHPRRSNLRRFNALFLCFFCVFWRHL